MESKDIDSSFVFNGDPSTLVIQTVQPCSTELQFPMSFNSVDMLTPSLLSHCSNNPLTSLPPPPASTFTSFLNEDGNYYYTSPALQQLGFGNSVVGPLKSFHRTSQRAKPYGFFSPVP
ncbi:hypothetical protein SADUNF_Sadunf07G0101900 [Salix dunnii]|uniref:Uncharacterized protein n=1 Tax=Salix dunnii TaxID=1413687 RepID=A0A835MZE3_9ROSI|nr:hypothetical protein SADUNF_Sadunf07G0101900 [Salix dunnii]